jgi:hypothetical protein
MRIALGERWITLDSIAKYPIPRSYLSQHTGRRIRRFEGGARLICSECLSRPPQIQTKRPALYRFWCP